MRLSNKPLLIIGIGISIIILILVGGYYFMRKRSVLGSVSHVRRNNQLILPSPVPLSTLQKQQLNLGTSTATKEKTFIITGGNYYFTPNKITVNKGDKITIVFTDVIGSHNLVIHDINIQTPIIQAGKSTTVTFTADKTGSYLFYCSIPPHMQLGMKGTLIVQ